jgi:hypothetical protein
MRRTKPKVINKTLVDNLVIHAYLVAPEVGYPRIFGRASTHIWSRSYIEPVFTCNK